MNREPDLVQPTPQGSSRTTAAPVDGTLRVTIAQVAAAAGVSPTTVSHVLTGKRPVGSTTRERVEGAVRQLGYRPNIVARNLRTKRSYMIAIVVPDITNPYYTVLARGLADRVEGAGYATYVCNTDASARRERKFVQDVLDRGVDGLVMASVRRAASTVGATEAGATEAGGTEAGGTEAGGTEAGGTEVSGRETGAAAEIARTVRLGTPIVCLGDSIDHPEVDRVTADDASGSRAATRHLLSAGARRIAMIQGSAGEGLSRVRGYHQALTEAGRTPEPALERDGQWTRAGGRGAMRSLLAADARPDAVFCANDLMAIGAMDAARELGLSIPHDLALVGFDDVDAAAMVTPALTTVRNPSYDAGCAAADLLLSRMFGQHTASRRTVVLPCRLIPRASG
jgi:LacI family transcriptional regulator